MDDHRGVEDTPMSQRLTNDDFRKLLMTPRSTPSGGAHPSGSVREAMANSGSMPPPTENKGELRRKKKSYYAALKKQEDTKLAELAEKYRDRARERRDGLQDGNPLDPISNTSSAYRAVAPDVKSGMDAKERRRQMIQESKYLGGDMEHTHLVKGLDYALLQKVRSEIQTREQEQEAEMERLVTEPVEPVKEKKEVVVVEEELQFKTTVAKNIYNMIVDQKSKKVTRNELFAPGRMAYVVELDEEGTIDSDIPTTLTRSKADVPEFDERTSSATTNDVIIEKLAQIFSYLRHGRHRKLKKLKEKSGEKGRNDDSIYGDIGDYVVGERRGDRGDQRARDSYFDKHDADVDKDEGAGPVAPRPEERDKRSAALLSRLAAEPEGYAECYPGLREMDDAIDDSDDEVDYSKMDAGNKKGPIGRWDFDTQEEYSAYMSSKEALPKAAFQYGVKTQDGRKTRKTKDKSEKAELDREWQQIQNIIQKRKVPASGDEPGFKTPKY
ncbi:protein Red [Leptidea sinapis]|nr:protein Red [Leptidea sinapis]XP_050677356.1 protein Red [Leptidea sinapis]XP_050677357.1 protein Red [Leptidea sinapis]XP_050677359.1 protein Red [Leptidea sinapis]